MTTSLQTTLDFLRALRVNNTTEWFHAHRAEYEIARNAFEALISDVLIQFKLVDDLGSVQAADTIHRINRDIRFSADKSPYKREMSALIGAEGRKSIGRAYYMQIAPDGESFVTAGADMLEPDELQHIRETIATDAKPLKAILSADSFKTHFGTMRGDQVKTAPKGFAKDHPDLALLRYKEFMAEHRFTDQEVLSADFAAQIVETCQTMKPFVVYFDNILGPRVKREHGKH